MIQARILRDIIEYIQDKTGQESHIQALEDLHLGKVNVTIKFTIGRDYPGMKPDEGGE